MDPMFAFKFFFAESRSQDAPSREETLSVSSDCSGQSCVMLRKKPMDLKIYTAIFRQPTAELEQDSSVMSMQSSVQYFINRVRALRGLPQLEHSRHLTHMARHHAERMALRGAIFHSCKTVAELQSHLQSSLVGENIQRGKKMRDIHDNMLSCRAQRRNVVSPDFTELGVGICSHSDGMLYMVQLFRCGAKNDAVIGLKDQFMSS